MNESLFRSEAWQWLSRHTGIAVRNIRAGRLPGATSSAVFRIRDGNDESTPRFVLRVHDNEEWLAREPDLAQHEAAALQFAVRNRLRAPALGASASGEAGLGRPIVLMTCLEGQVSVPLTAEAGWLRALAQELAAIHRIDATDFSWSFESWADPRLAVPPVWTANALVWKPAIALWRGAAPTSPPVFLHRDYHPVNVLWDGVEISGVVDWVNACCGPAGVDVAHCRCNLALIYGVEAADTFLRAYEIFAPEFRYEPYWDIDSVFSMFLPEPEFYAPWREFGFPLLTAERMHAAVDAFMESVMKRAASR